MLKVLQLLSGAVCCENRDSEKGTPVDPSCSHNLVSEDGCSVAKECSEEYDGSDDDYASIQRPAFMVDGEPNFDSGPPEDGWEYLRRVRYYHNCQQLIAGAIMNLCFEIFFLPDNFFAVLLSLYC